VVSSSVVELVVVCVEDCVSLVVVVVVVFVVFVAILVVGAPF
jgi:hypothetical protein